jgi:hypothetical protein
VLRGLPEDEQEKAGRAIIDFGAHDDDLQLTDEQVAEIRRRMSNTVDLKARLVLPRCDSLGVEIVIACRHRFDGG